MRRFAATMLVGLFSFSLIGPALFVDADSSLPACCRRDGKHHCAMNIADPQEVPSGAVVKIWGPRCPSFPTACAFPAGSQAALPAGSQLAFAWLLQHPAVQAQAEAGYRISFSRSRQKRGPPSLLS
jgi:hypothetical protein